MKKTLLLLALLVGCAYAATTPIATRPWVQTQIANAIAAQTGHGYVYTATVVTNADGTYTYSAPYAGTELTNCATVRLTFAVCTNRALRLSYVTIPGAVTNRLYYAWTGSTFTNRYCAALPMIEPYVATNTAGDAYQSYRATGADGTQYGYRYALGLGILYAKTNETWRANLATTTIGDLKAANLKGE